MYKAIATDCLGFPLSFKEAAETISRQGFEGFWFNIERDREVSAAETRELLERFALAPAGFMLPVEFRKDQGTFENDMRKFTRRLRFAAEIGITRCATWFRPASDELDYRENFEMHRARLTEVAKLLEGEGLSLGFEFVGAPEKRAGRRYEFIHSLDQMMEFCAAVGTRNCGLLLDSWHWDMAGQIFADFQKIESESQVVLVHINDAPPGKTPEQQLDGVRRLPGETGVLKIDDFFRGLQGLGYTGPVVVEPFEKSLAGMPFADASQKVMDSMMRVWPSKKAPRGME
jgi:2-keto-myo-inositol isomerase